MPCHRHRHRARPSVHLSVCLSLSENRLHESVDVWGISSKLNLYLEAKKLARERAERAAGGGGGGVPGWGAWGGAKGKADTYMDDRRREEAERIRSQLERVTRPSQWQSVRGSGINVLVVLVQQLLRCCWDSSF